MENTPREMTAGQMKQLSGKLLKVIPSDLSFREAEQLLRDRMMAGQIDSIMRQYRTDKPVTVTPADDAHDVFCTKVNFEMGIDADLVRRLPKRSWRSKQGKLRALFGILSRDRPSAETRVEFMQLGNATPGEARLYISAEGYRPADAREAVALLSQCSDHSAFPVDADGYTRFSVLPENGIGAVLRLSCRHKKSFWIADFVHESDLRMTYPGVRMCLVVKL